MSRWIGLFNLAQGGVYAALAGLLMERWAPMGWALYAVAAAQALAGLVLVAGRGPGLARWVSVLSLLLCAALAGLHLQAGVHILQTFTPVADKQAVEFLGGVLLALPWAVFFPTWQLLATRPSARVGGATAAALLAGLLLPPAAGAARGGPDTTFAQVDGAATAAWVHRYWTRGERGVAPEGAGPVLLGVSVVVGGEVVEEHTLRGSSLAEALGGLALRTPALGDGAIVVDVATAAGPLRRAVLVPEDVALLRPGAETLLVQDSLLPTVRVWRDSQAVVGRQLGLGASITTVSLRRLKAGRAQRWVRVNTFMAHASGVTPLEVGWSAPPALSPDALLAAAVAGGRHIAVNMADNGRYAYEVKGPSGEYGRGYNFPRHAGGTWFLARLAQRTSDPQIQAAARKGLDFMVANTRFTDDGRAYVYDPTRKDGKAWVGTTGLGLLAFIALGVRPDLQAQYAAFIASSVDERGQVRGDMDVATGAWPAQDEVTYAQGQGLLALAAAHRAGVPGVKEALERAADHADGAYGPWPAVAYKTLDEHWTCLAAAAVQDALGRPAGERVCRAYLAEQATFAPTPGSPEQPLAGPAAGLAEAVIALAEIERRAGVQGLYHERSVAYGASLLANQYQASDAPLLGQAPRLIGGFRDRPWRLDVRVDAVQHIGCALLGVEQLLRGQALPGGMP